MGAAAVKEESLSRRKLIGVFGDRLKEDEGQVEQSSEERPAFGGRLAGMTRRQWLAGMAGLVAGSHGARWARSAWATASGDRARAMEILRGLIHRYTRDRHDAWVVVHGVRAMGTAWRVDDGTRAVDHVLATFVKTRAVGIRRYLYVPLDIEMHQNSFLETFLDAGVGWQQAVRVGNQAYSFRNLFEHATMLFSFSNANSSTASAGMHPRETDWFAWSLIAFPFGLPPEKDGWRNAFGEEIRIAEILTAGFRMMEEATAPLARAMEQGKPLLEKVGVHALSSGGAHLLSGLVSAVRHGYTQGDARRRLARQLDLLVYRLPVDLQLIRAFYRERRSHPLSPMYELDARLYSLGHALGNLASARREGLFRPTPAQQGQIEGAETALYRTVDELRGMDLDRIRKVDHMLFHRIVGDASYAYQALSLTG